MQLTLASIVYGTRLRAIRPHLHVCQALHFMKALAAMGKNALTKVWHNLFTWSGMLHVSVATL